MKNINKFIYLIVVIIIAIICLYYIGFKKQSIFITDNITINIGDKLPRKKDFIKKRYLNKCEEINFDNNINYFHKKNNITVKCKNINYKISLTVKDIKPPVIDEQEIICKVKEKCDIKSLVKITEDSKDDVNISVEGDYDLNKLGEYKIIIVAADKGMNKTQQEITLRIISKDAKITKSKNGYTIITENGITKVNNLIIVNKSYSLPKDYVPSNLVKIDNCPVIDYVKNAYDDMVKDLNKEGMNIKVGTCYRSYGFQNILYTNYIKRDGQEKADTFSARPGFSEHQTGLAIDISPVNNSFTNTNEAIWIKNNAYKCGFIIRYPENATDYTGYKYESWHIRYVGKEIALKLYKGNGDYISLEEYFGLDSVYKN